MYRERKLELGMSGQALGDVMSFDQIVETGKKYGITHFELWPVNVPGTGFGYRDRDITCIQKIIKEKGITVDCVTVEAAFCEAAVETPEYYSEILKGAIDAAAAVGAGLVNHYCYFINLPETPDFNRMETYWNPALAYAKERGIVLVLENEAHDATRRPELMAAIIKHFNDPCFLTNYDAANYYHASAEAFPAAYEILKPYIGYVHLKNACIHRENSGQQEEDKGAPMSGVFEPADIQYRTIPDGSINIAGLVSALKRDGIYSGICTLEPHTTPERAEYFYETETSWLRETGLF